METQKKPGSVREGYEERVVEIMVKRGAGQYNPTLAESFSGIDGVQKEDCRLVKRECVGGVEKIKKI